MGATGEINESVSEMETPAIFRSNEVFARGGCGTLSAIAVL
jgi:hypothetical protein